MPACTRTVRTGDKFNVGSIVVQCFLTPCHTPGHVLYLCADDDDEPVLFSGKASPTPPSCLRITFLCGALVRIAQATRYS